MGNNGGRCSIHSPHARIDCIHHCQSVTRLGVCSVSRLVASRTISLSLSLSILVRISFFECRFTLHICFILFCCWLVRCDAVYSRFVRLCVAGLTQNRPCSTPYH